MKVPTLPLTLTLALGVAVGPSLAAPAMDGGDLEDAVEDALRTNVYVPSYRIDVDNIDGIITLRGRVMDMLAEKRAIEVTRSVRGVRSVIDELTVHPSMRTDPSIESSIESAWLRDPATDSYEVEADVTSGVATLEGEVDSFAEKTLCETVAMGVPGVLAIDNQIRVRYEADRPTSEIERDIRRRLAHDTILYDQPIAVEVEDDEAILTGDVASATARQRAKTLAWVAGIREVDTSNLKVDYEATREHQAPYLKTFSDSKLEEAVEDTFLFHPRVASYEIEVIADNGMVTLRGAVDSLAAKRRAEEAAENTVGVWHVANRIRVRPPEIPRDTEILTEVREALEQSPAVEAREIIPAVELGIVTLRGTVDTWDEYRAAARVLETIPGVIMVDNHLDVQDVSGPSDFLVLDWRIERDVESELYWSPFVDEEKVHVSVDDGEVTLTGTVEDWYEAMAAAENALEAGALKVHNDLKVRFGPDYYRPELEAGE